MIKSLCKIISEKLLATTSLSEEEKNNYRYGLELFIRLLIEVIILYSLALLFNIFWPVFIATVSFIILRTKAGGAHFLTYFQCLLFSVIVFLGIGFFAFLVIIYTPILLIWILLTGATGVYLTGKYAPATTEQLPATSQQHKDKARKQSLIIVTALLLIHIITLFTLPNLQPLIFASSLGLFLEILALHPLSFKIINYISYKLNKN